MTGIEFARKHDKITNRTIINARYNTFRGDGDLALLSLQEGLKKLLELGNEFSGSSKYEWPETDFEKAEMLELMEEFPGE